MRRMGRMLAVMALAVLVPAAGAVGGQVYFYHTDPAGTPIAMSDASGNVVWRADYRPFGEIQTESGTAPNDKLFVGKEKDDETGLYYFGARYMDDRIGRFISPDPVGPVDPKTGTVNNRNLLDPQRLNPYAYSLNNPYRYVDPDGEDPRNLHRLFGPVLSPGSAGEGGGIGGGGMGWRSGTRAGRGGSAVNSGGISTGSGSQGANTRGNAPPEKLYHYTNTDPGRIAEEGLKPGASGKVFTTPDGNLSPMQAQIDLALPPNRGLPQHLLEVDVQTLRSMGIAIPEAQTVPRTFNMPGGGREIVFPHALPPEAITVVK